MNKFIYNYINNTHDLGKDLYSVCMNKHKYVVIHKNT